MDKAKLRETATTWLGYGIGIIKFMLIWTAWAVGIAVVLYVVRMPFYEDRVEVYVNNVQWAVIFAAIVLGWFACLALIFSNRYTAAIAVVLVVVSSVSQCGDVHCTESRYVTCP